MNNRIGHISKVFLSVALLFGVSGCSDFLDENDPSKVVSHELMKEVDFGRIRDIAEGPDGAIYFSTSNRDGRGNERSGDDKIYRIRKK